MTDSATRAKESVYQLAKGCLEKKEYDLAKSHFASIPGYNDADTMCKECDYRKASDLLAAGKNKEAEAIFKSLGDYSDSKTKAEQCIYNQAEILFAAGKYEEAKALYAASLYKSGEYEEAYAIYATIGGYKDVDSLLKNDQNFKLAPYLTVGNIVIFGTYPQTSSGTDSTPIEWIVLDYDAANNRSLIISRYGLDVKPYNTSYAAVTWETSALRSWLNKDFLNKAFTAKEQGAIILTTVDNSSSQGYWSTTSGGKNTQDKIFLLSYTEANKFYNVTRDNNRNTASRLTMTAYTKECGAETSALGTGFWWLRSPGATNHEAVGICADGSLGKSDIYTNAAIRPALWLDLNAVY